MSNESIATFLVDGLPYAWGVKAVVFFALAATLVMQRTQSRLGFAINALFAATVFTSIWTTWLLMYLTRGTDGNDIDTTGLWLLVVFGNLLPWIVNIFGISVAVYTYRAEPIETRDHRDRRQDARDLRQDEQQVIHDKTALDLTRRGEYFTVAGLEIDGKRVSMDIEQHDLDDRESDLNQRDHDADVRDEEGRQP